MPAAKRRFICPSHSKIAPIIPAPYASIISRSIAEMENCSTLTHGGSESFIRHGILRHSVECVISAWLTAREVNGFLPGAYFRCSRQGGKQKARSADTSRLRPSDGTSISMLYFWRRDLFVQTKSHGL